MVNEHGTINDDTINGSSGSDFLSGGEGADLINAGDGNDTVTLFDTWGTSSARMSTQHIAGNQDTVFLGAGNDSIRPGLGANELHGGGGTDTLNLVDAGSSSAAITLSADGTSGTYEVGGYTSTFDGFERFIAAKDDDSFDLSGMTDGVTIDMKAGDDTVTGGEGNDTINGGTGTDTIDSGDGDDVIRNQNGGVADTDADVIRTRAGDDTIHASLGNDTINGGDGTDTYNTATYLNDQAATIDLSASTVSIGGASQRIVSTENLVTGDEADTITGSNVANKIETNDGNDTVNSGSGNDTILAGAGNDVVDGGSGADSIDGGAGNDTINGGTGNDELTGGDGNDTFIISDGEDTITDFNTGNTGSISDDDQSNNDFVDLSGYYNQANLIAYNDANPSNQYDNALKWMQGDLADGKLDAADAGWTAGNSLSFTGISPTDLTFDNTGVMCFAKGTMIQTIAGEVAIEDLGQGDMILTKDRGYQPLRWIGTTGLSASDLSANEKLRPIRICAGALGNGLPKADFLVSPQHRILVRSTIVSRMFDGAKEVLVAAKQLVMIDGIDIAHDVESVEYFHMLFDQHEIVISNGAESESLFTGPEALKSVSPEGRIEILTLFPELSSIDYSATACRIIAKGRKGRQLAVRHSNNGQSLAS